MQVDEWDEIGCCKGRNVEEVAVRLVLQLHVDKLDMCYGPSKKKKQNKKRFNMCAVEEEASEQKRTFIREAAWEVI